MKLLKFFSVFAATQGYSDGAPPFEKVLKYLKPGGPHEFTYASKDQYSKKYHHTSLDITKHGGSATVRMINLIKEIKLLYTL